MIEINLLPGAGKKPRGRSAGVNIAGVGSRVLAQVKDPWLIGAVFAVLLAGAGVGGMYWLQRAKEISLDERLQKAQQDSIRYAAVIREKRKAEARRDSLLRQVEMIRSIDNRRFVWPHIMDEVSRALPPYTWLTAVSQINSPVQSAAPPPGPPPAAGDKGAKSPAGPPAADTTSIESIRAAFRIVGNTVDIQALTRFMTVLEASPFVENVQLVKSTLILVDGKEVTEFQLDASYQPPDPSAIRTVPVALTVLR